MRSTQRSIQKFILIILSTVTIVGCSSIPLSDVKQAAIADNVSTAIALEQGLPELNPLGFPTTVVIKILVIEWAKTQPETDRRFVETSATALWTGAAVNNVVAVIGGGSLLSPVVGVVTAIQLWQRSADK